MNNTLAHTGNQPVNRLHGIDSGLTATKAETSTDEENSHSTTLSQRVAICFAAGVIGALAVLLFSHVLSWFGPGPKGPIPFPASFEPPGIYRPLFWGGLWGLLFGFFIKPVWSRLYLVGFLYFLIPMAALFLFFFPMGGAGYFGLKASEPMFPLYVTLINVPFGITIALVARAIIGKNP
ncbi:MAG TPA: hypothetical protein VFC26_07165 [Verrucomicrobiae bacterium]|nr:hypothetical protein [Verrucomicrobiae bacterium]